MNILIINHYAGSKYHGMDFKCYYMAKEWVKLGNNVCIVAADQSHIRTKKVIISEKKDFNIEIIDGITYLWLKTLKYNDNSFQRAFNIISFIVQLFKYSKIIVKTFNPQIVISSSTYPADCFPARYIAKLSNAKFIYEIHDLWPLSPMILGNMSKYHPFIMAMQFAENYCYRYCDAVVSALPKVKEHVLKHGLNLKKLHIVENGINVDEWSNKSLIPEKLHSLIEEEKAKGKFLLAYTGQHGLANSLNTILEAANNVKDKKVAFFFIGNGPEKNNLIEYAKRLNLNNVFFCDSVKKTEIPNLLVEFDCLIITLKNNWEIFKYGISPNKLMDYMMSGKPIIQAINAGNDIVKEAGCGLSVQGEDSKALANAILEIMNTPLSEREAMGRRGNEYVIKNHDYKVLAKKYLDILESL